MSYNDKERYIYVRGKKIYVPDEVYRAYKKVYRPPKVRPKNLTIGRSVQRTSNIEEL